jgi:2-keto-4-pentenoate hydratase
MAPSPAAGLDPQLERSSQALERAWQERSPIRPLRLIHPGQRIADAYAIQNAWTESRLSAGEEILGRKIGLTSAAVQEQMGVDEPDYGTLWGSRFFAAVDGRAVAPFDLFLQPRIEGELAFLLGEPPAGDKIEIEDVLDATEAVAATIEIVDSRIADWDIELFDTVADNASYGGYTLGPWSPELRSEDLRTIGMMMTRDGETVSSGIGAAALGHPARAVAWLLTKLRSFGIEAKAGDVILSGALGPTVPVLRGDEFTLSIHGQPRLTIAFE